MKIFKNTTTGLWTVDSFLAIPAGTCYAVKIAESIKICNLSKQTIAEAPISELQREDGSPYGSVRILHYPDRLQQYTVQLSVQPRRYFRFRKLPYRKQTIQRLDANRKRTCNAVYRF